MGWENAESGEGQNKGKMIRRQGPNGRRAPDWGREGEGEGQDGATGAGTSAFIELNLHEED